MLQFSKEPEYVDPCFNGTMMPANEDNIRRMQEKIMEISTKDAADLRKALTLAFRLFREVSAGIRVEIGESVGSVPVAFQRGLHS